MKARVTLSVNEIIAVKAALHSQARATERLIEFAGDPHGVQADNLAEINSVLEKLEAAFSRAIA